jgi:small subunit ribosomal protein S20
MPILANAKKALRVSKKKTAINKRVKSLLKTFVDKVFKSPTLENASEAFSRVDKAVKKNVIHKNKAARMKQQISKIVAGKTTNTAAPKKSAVKKTAAKKKPAKKSTK